MREDLRKTAMQRIAEGLAMGEALPRSPERDALDDARALGQAELHVRAPSRALPAVTDPIPQLLAEALVVLGDAGAEFALIGGCARNAYAEVRPTKDVDFVVGADATSYPALVASGRARIPARHRLAYRRLAGSSFGRMSMRSCAARVLVSISVALATASCAPQAPPRDPRERGWVGVYFGTFTWNVSDFCGEPPNLSESPGPLFVEEAPTPGILLVTGPGLSCPVPIVVRTAEHAEVDPFVCPRPLGGTAEVLGGSADLVSDHITWNLEIQNLVASVCTHVVLDFEGDREEVAAGP